LTNVPNPKLGVDFQIMFHAKLLEKERKKLFLETISNYQSASGVFKNKKYQK
jgi:hypothetical protein